MFFAAWNRCFPRVHHSWSGAQIKMGSTLPWAGAREMEKRSKRMMDEVLELEGWLKKQMISIAPPRAEPHAHMRAYDFDFNCRM